MITSVVLDTEFRRYDIAWMCAFTARWRLCERKRGNRKESDIVMGMLDVHQVISPFQHAARFDGRVDNQ